jgi:hypothetical protein
MKYIVMLMVFTGCIASRVIENKWIAQKISDSTLVDRLHVDSNIVIENTYLHGLFKEGLLIDRYNKTSLRFLDTTLSKASRLTYFVDYKIDSLRIYFWIPMSRNSYPYTLYYVVNDKIIDSFKTRNNPIWIRRHPIKDTFEISKGIALRGGYYVLGHKGDVLFIDTIVLPAQNFRKK